MRKATRFILAQGLAAGVALAANPNVDDSGAAA